MKKKKRKIDIITIADFEKNNQKNEEEDTIDDDFDEKKEGSKDSDSVQVLHNSDELKLSLAEEKQEINKDDEKKKPESEIYSTKYMYQRWGILRVAKGCELPKDAIYERKRRIELGLEIDDEDQKKQDEEEEKKVIGENDEIKIADDDDEEKKQEPEDYDLDSDSDCWFPSLAALEEEKEISSMPGIIPLTVEYLEEITKKNWEEAQEYLRQLHESDGFDIDVIFKKWDATIVPIASTVFEDDEHPLYLELKELTQIAIDFFNGVAESDYKLVKVRKANYQMIGGDIYYITYSASDEESDHLAEFQAKLLDPSSYGGGQVEIQICRMKSG